MNGRRYALIILDGLADAPTPSGAPPTPLESARTPNLDRLAAEGETGLLTIIGPGVAPESDAGVLALLGYDPAKDSPGRGVLEALGAEVPLAPGDVALRLNFATADGAGEIVDSRVGRNLSTREAAELARSVTAADLLAPEGIRAEVRPTVGHRGVLWLHPVEGGRLSGAISNADPFYERVGGMGHARRVEHPRPRPVVPEAATPEAERTAAAVNLFLERARPVLAAHGVNARRALAGRRIANDLLLRSAGGIPDRAPPTFPERYHLSAAAVTEMPVERGIARFFGLADRFVGPMGPDPAAALPERARATRDALAESAFVYVHLKGPDEPGHDGDAERKRAIIEELDRSFFGPFLAGLDRTTLRLAVTADHATPAARKGHSDDPVPLLLWGAGVPSEGRQGAFSERSCAGGHLGMRSARELMPILLAPGDPATAE